MNKQALKEFLDTEGLVYVPALHIMFLLSEKKGRVWFSDLAEELKEKYTRTHLYLTIKTLVEAGYVNIRIHSERKRILEFAEKGETLFDFAGNCKKKIIKRKSN